jgi:hypothetical protein
MLNRIGAFHFGSPNRELPVKSLEASLKQASETEAINGALIVLPEAFNICSPYEPDHVAYPSEPNVRDSLERLCVQFDVSFVSGLIVKDSDGPQLPFNSAHLITSTSCQLLSRKQGKDDLAGILYEPCREGVNRTSRWGEIGIAALICIDAILYPQPHNPFVSHQELHDRVRAGLDTLSPVSRLLCVPARNRYFESAGLAEYWTDMHFVLANAGPKPSVIRAKGYEAATCSEGANRVIVVQNAS